MLRVSAIWVVLGAKSPSADELVDVAVRRAATALLRPVESLRIGHGGDLQVARITGLDVKTIRRGRQELDDELASRPTDRIRLTGGGRLLAEKKTRR